MIAVTAVKVRVCERHGGQTLVEFALIIPVFLLLMLGVVQMVVVGGAALAVNQAAISCARYASLNPSFAQSSVDTYLSYHRVAAHQRLRPASR